MKSQVPNPLKWNAEQPNLYKLSLELNHKGRLLERVERNIGFRKIEIKERQFYINGARVKLAGVCHHEIDPLTGRADTMRHAEEDVKIFKRANLNFARTSHYPCTQEFLDAADRLGFYVEAEAPFCWVGLRQTEEGKADPVPTSELMTPTSLMVDYFHTHPSVIIWSLANESRWSEIFALSNRFCKELDPTRPTTFSGPLPHDFKVAPFPIPEDCDILNRHYLSMPYDEALKEDPRPFLHGECFFELYHERGEVAVNPGIREMWAHGNADPDSQWGKYCAESFAEPSLWPGIHPGAWTHIYHSERMIGSEIWSGIDDIAYLPNGEIASSERGNALWGIIDGWRRPKPEWWLSTMIFSPVWFPVFQVDYVTGQTSVRVPVENRYSFTNLSELEFTWELAGATGPIKVSLPPSKKGEIEVSIPKGAPQGENLILRATDKTGTIVTARAFQLGQRKSAIRTKPTAGAPKWSDDGQIIITEGNGFSLVLNRATGDFDSNHPKHTGALLSFPALHLTQYECEDLMWFQKRSKKPYANLPDATTRVVKNISIAAKGDALEITIHDEYEHFYGSVRWAIDSAGDSTVNYDYTYTGDGLDTRELGVKTLLRPEYDEVKWRRWSEWGVFPEDHISRTTGRAKARRDDTWGPETRGQKPAWPWSLDQTELGTNDFRSIKFNIYEASLLTPDGSEVRAQADANAHFRACLAENGVKMHLLSRSPLAPVILKKDDHLTGEFNLSL